MRLADFLQIIFLLIMAIVAVLVQIIFSSYSRRKNMAFPMLMLFDYENFTTVEKKYTKVLLVFMLVEIAIFSLVCMLSE